MTLPSSAEIRGVLVTFRERLLSGFSWNLLSTVSLQGSVLVSSIIVARLLGLEKFGVYSILVGTVMTVAGIAQGGTGLVAIKFVAESLSVDNARVGRILRMCALMTAGAGVVSAASMALLAPFIASAILHEPAVEPYIRWISVAILFQVLTAYQYGALQGFGAFRALGKAGAIAGAVQLCAPILGAVTGGLAGAILGFVAASAGRLAGFGLLLHAVRSSHSIASGEKTRPEDWKLLWSFALPASLAGMVTLPCLWWVSILVARQPDGLAMVAVFSAVHQIRMALFQMPSLLNAVSFSVLSRLKSKGEVEKFRKVFLSNVTINAIYVMGAIAVIVPFGDFFLGLYGRQFTDGYWSLALLLTALFPETIAASVYQLIQSGGSIWTSLVAIVLPRDLSYVALTAVLLPKFGVIGAMMAYLIAHFIGLIATIALARRVADVANTSFASV